MTTPDAFGNLHRGAGAPDGGQFAEKQNSAPAATLTDEEVRDTHAVLMGPAVALARSYRIDPSAADDIVQDAWVDLLARNKGIDELVKDKALLKLVSRTVATRQTVGVQHGLRHEDFQARRVLREQEKAFESQHGRKMTPNELKDAADAIRLAAQPGRRPKADFYVERSTLSLDAPLDGEVNGGSSLGDTMVADESLPFDQQEDAAASALHEIENGMATKVDVRRDVWKIVSIRNGAPEVQPGCLTSNEARRHRTLVEQAGGVHVLAQRWLDGEASFDEEAALFAPFGSIDGSAREKAAEVLDDHPSFADNLWGEALKTASRR